jgi:integrase/recombinase XerD
VTKPFSSKCPATLTAIQTGVRVTELTKLRVGDVSLSTGAHCRVTGKGRKQRIAPLKPETGAVLREWLHERGGDDDDPLFPTRQGRQLSRDAVAKLLRKHIAAATGNCPSLAAKRVSPHALRHYVDGWVMWPAGVFPLLGLSLGPVPAT